MPHILNTLSGPIRFWENEFCCPHTARNACAYCAGLTEPEQERLIRNLRTVYEG